MSERDDELELQALQRELDDAFATTRPRAGFDDELWARIQARQPAGRRLSGAFGAFLGALRAVPRVPAAAVATILVLVLGIGLLSLGGFGRQSTSTAGEAPAELSQQAGPGGSRNNAGGAYQYGAFGRLPSPQGPASPAAPSDLTPKAAQGTVTPYYGPAVLTWSGQLTIAVGTAPVFRYSEPSVGDADQFAATLGTTLLARQTGFLGEYESSDYLLKVRGTTGAFDPAYFILSGPNMPAVEVQGASPGDVAVLFLANHNLLPDWPYTTTVTPNVNGLTRVQLLRQFEVPGYGNANAVDFNGQRYGIEVDLDGNRPELVSGPLPLQTQLAGYPIVTPDQAIAPLLAAGSSPAVVGAPAVNLTHVELVYVLVPAGDHSFYEPAYLFTGTFKQGTVTYEKRVLVAAVDPSQRS